MDESATGSANLWSGPRKRAGRFSEQRPAEPLVGRAISRHSVQVEIGFDDSSLIMRKLFEIHTDVMAIRDLLEDEDDGAGEDDDDS